LPEEWLVGDGGIAGLDGLVHFTLQEYFNQHSEHFENSHSAMAEVCLAYLNFDSVNKISYTLDSAPADTCFLQYASSYWGLYAGNGLTEGVRSLALQLLGKFGRHKAGLVQPIANRAKHKATRGAASPTASEVCGLRFHRLPGHRGVKAQEYRTHRP